MLRKGLENHSHKKIIGSQQLIHYIVLWILHKLKSKSCKHWTWAVGNAKLFTWRHHSFPLVWNSGFEPNSWIWKQLLNLVPQLWNFLTPLVNAGVITAPSWQATYQNCFSHHQCFTWLWVFACLVDFVDGETKRLIWQNLFLSWMFIFCGIEIQEMGNVAWSWGVWGHNSWVDMLRSWTQPQRLFQEEQMLWWLLSEDPNCSFPTFFCSKSSRRVAKYCNSQVQYGTQIFHQCWHVKQTSGRDQLCVWTIRGQEWFPFIWTDFCGEEMPFAVSRAEKMKPNKQIVERHDTPSVSTTMHLRIPIWDDRRQNQATSHERCAKNALDSKCFWKLNKKNKVVEMQLQCF